MTTLAPVTLSDPAQLDLTSYRGDTGRFRLTVTRGGAPLDVSAAAWDCDIRQTPDGALVGSMTVTPVAGQTNVVDVTMPNSLGETAANTDPAKAAEPFVGVWDLEMTEGVAPAVVTVTTLLRGKITLGRDVSRPPIGPPDTGGEVEPPAALGTSAPVGLHLPPLRPGVTPERVGGPDVAEAVSLAAVSPAGPS